MTPDEQEALSLRYSNLILIIVPLSSKKVAIFDNSRQLLAIRSTIPTHQELCELTLTAAHRLVIDGCLEEPQSSAEELGF